MLAAPALAGDLRIATFHTELSREGPGLLLRDLLRGDDAAAQDVARRIVRTAPDIVLLQDIDYDMELRALAALRDLIAAEGLRYDHIFALPPNSGMPTGFDMDGDRRLGEPEDAQGYGTYSGEGGMAILSRYKVDEAGVQDFTPMLWRDLPDALLPVLDGAPFPSAQAQAALRLADVAQWAVPILHDTGPLTVLAFHANAPVFDGPEDRNGRRNHDQLRFWQHYLDGAFGAAPKTRFVLLGHANQDPVRGEGIKAAITGLLADPRLQDPRPVRRDAPPDQPAEATVEWPRVSPSHMRVSYVLPSRDWIADDAGLDWPTPDERARGSRHALVWVDLRVD